MYYIYGCLLVTKETSKRRKIRKEEGQIKKTFEKKERKNDTM